jgi:acetyl-CoA carboxylase biotin carboxyl carrier protein
MHVSDDDTRMERSISTAELTQIVRTFADSDLRELRLQVGDVDLLVSRNEHVDGAAPPARPPAPMATPVAVPTAPATAALPSVAGTAGTALAPATPVGTDGSVTADRAGLVAVHSPAVGVFYRRPTPDKPPFAEVGSTVAAGDPVGTIEVMKMFTTVISAVAGTVAEICVEDATLVEYGQVIMYLAPTEGA